MIREDALLEMRAFKQMWAVKIICKNCKDKSQVVQYLNNADNTVIKCKNCRDKRIYRYLEI